MGKAQVGMVCDNAVEIFAYFARFAPRSPLYLLLTSWNISLNICIARSNFMTVSHAPSPVAMVHCSSVAVRTGQSSIAPETI